jgi:hypothetical protein
MSSEFVYRISAAWKNSLTIIVFVKIYQTVFRAVLCLIWQCGHPEGVNCWVLMWSELAWFMWSDFVLKWSEVKWSEVSHGEVLRDKNTMFLRVTLYWRYLSVLRLFQLCILYCGCFNSFCNVWMFWQLCGCFGNMCTCLTFCWSCIMIYTFNKNQQDAFIYSQIISIINLYMFRAGLLLIIRWHISVYTEVGMCHAFMLGGCWQDTEKYLLIMSSKPARNM